MLTHHAVAEVAVIAVPDEIRGEVIESYVVLTKGYTSSPDLAQDIQQWVKLVMRRTLIQGQYTSRIVSQRRQAARSSAAL
jgi:acyl-coenzyme A synthetase/AMP-(fatty) acid ligase